MNILNKTIAPTVTFDGSAHEASAIALASAIGHTLDADLAMLDKAKADYEGGAFVVLFNLFGHLSAEQIKALPDHTSETGNNPRFYKTRKLKADGKEKLTDRDYYKVIAESLPSVMAHDARIELLGRSMKDPTKFNLSDIPEDIKAMAPAKRHAEIAKHQRAITTARKNVPDALELYSQMQRFNELPGVRMHLLYALSEDGTHEMDGSEKAGGIMKIDPTPRPIVITSKLERRAAVDTATIGVSSFMKFDIPKAIEQGGSWDALMATVKKGPKEKDKNGNDNAKLIRTPDTAAQVMTDFADYLTAAQDEKTQAMWQAFDKSLHGAGSDDAFMNACIVFNALQLLVGNPKDQARFQKLWNDAQQAAA